MEARLPNNINISILQKNGKFGEIDGEGMVLRLDEAGIICSSASACASGSGESEVVRKIYHDELRAKNTLRFSMGRDTKEKHIKILLNKLAQMTRLN